jgi:predicted nucleic acid-binding protein
MNIILHELSWSQTSETLSIANKLDIALYDAAYLFLSEKISAPLVTSDTKLYEKAKDHFKVLHLKGYV